MKTVRHSPNPSKVAERAGGMSMVPAHPDVVEQVALSADGLRLFTYASGPESSMQERKTPDKMDFDPYGN
jgi:hypothetical protein